VRHLENAIPYATEPMQNALRALVQWYRTGEDSDRAKYDIAWVADKDSPVDTINGFIEVYVDSRGIKGAGKRSSSRSTGEDEAIKTIGDNAQWFEDNMPCDAKYRKAEREGHHRQRHRRDRRDRRLGPVTPIGINLPNDQRIREEYGSKSVSLSNVVEAYDKSTPGTMRGEFSWTPEEAERAAKYGALADNLDDRHARGHRPRLRPAGGGFKGTPQQAIKEHFSALEEGRADLIGLYYIADPKLVEIGVIPAADQENIAAPIRGLHAQRAGAAAARPRRDDHRRGSHAQPPDDRPLADGEHEGHRAADARRQDLLDDG
jgi:dipeptidyl-peptidase-3